RAQGLDGEDGAVADAAHGLVEPAHRADAFVLDLRSDADETHPLTFGVLVRGDDGQRHLRALALDDEADVLARALLHVVDDRLPVDGPHSVDGTDAVPRAERGWPRGACA